MKTVAVLLPLLFALGDSRSVFKRNAYGDEAVTPAPDAPAVAVAAPEQTVQQLPAEPAPAQEAPVQQSGYRAKRGAQNGYGDEPVAPKAGYPQDAPVVAPEQTAQQVPSEPAPAQEAPVQQSGYRAKRGAQNGYGDEPVAPKAGYPQDAPLAAPEQTAQQVPSEPAPAQEAPVQQSGYRAKRDAQNGYGDEPVTEAPKPVEAETPAPEQAVEQVPAETAPGAPVEHSGY